MEYKLKVIVKLSNGRYQTLYPTKKTKISRNSVLGKMKSAYLKVTYLHGRGLENSGTYFNRKDFINALNVFTEKPLLEYIKGGSFE